MCLGDYSGGVLDCDRAFALGCGPAYPSMLMYTWQPARDSQPIPNVPAAHLIRVGPLGGATGLRFPLSEVTVRVGGDPSCDLCIDDLPLGSYSAVLEWEKQGYTMRSLDLDKPVRVNCTPAFESALQSGDVLSLGKTDFLYLTPRSGTQSFWREVYRVLTLDRLTGAVNRRYLTNYLAHALPEASEAGLPFALLMLDVDHFKAINAEHGHEAGDSVMRDLVALTRQTVGKDQVLARVGGDEFVLASPNTDAPQARTLAEQVRLAVAEHQVRWRNMAAQVTVSIGLAVFKPGDACCGDFFIYQASRGVDQAKRMGRNRVAEGGS
jgi:diguanylate cyclase (GGDEF)-like protein